MSRVELRSRLWPLSTWAQYTVSWSRCTLSRLAMCA